ncbi:Ig-like domain-containing protein [Taibaiella lutea]|nr:T9SS type A sorting domain-containing protein [Taibaiella lutea]
MYSTSTANATSRIAVIYPASQLSTIAGSAISNIYFNKTTASAMSGTPSFKIYLKEVSATDWGSSAITWATEIAGATLVFDGNPASIVGSTTGWKNFPLTANFPYSGSQNLAVFMEYQNTTASSSISWSYDYTGPCVNTSNNNTTKYINNTSGTLGASLSSTNYRRPYIGFDYAFANCAGIPATPVIAGPVSSPCPATAFTLTSTGSSIGTGITYDWQYYNTVTSTWTSTGGTAASYIVASGITAPTQYRLVSNCSFSGQQSISNTVSIGVSSGLAGGTYTINNTAPTAGTNYHSFTEAIAAMHCGILGSVVFNVTPGTPYNEIVSVDNIPGTSPANTIRINGNGALVQYANTANDRQLLTISGTKYLKIDSLNFKALATDYGWAALITNGASYDSITRCKFDLSAVTSISSGNTNGITFSGSNTAATTAGVNGTHCFIDRNYLLSATGTGGMYYAISVASGGNDSNTISNNIFENFYYYGIYISTATGTKVLGNDLHKTNKTGSLTTFYGIYLTGSMPGTIVNGNRLHNPIAASASSTSSFYGIYNLGDATAANPMLIANNALYNINQGGIIYGIYNSSSPYTGVFHNTISIDKVLTGTSSNYGIYATGTNPGTTIKNNIVSITAGTSGAKYGFYYSTAASIDDAQKNNIYVSSSQSGTQYYGYYTTAYATQAAFQTAYPALEVNSPLENPQFASPATGDLTPNNVALFGTGTNLLSVVPRDIINVPRSLTPTPGAFELTSTATNDAGTLSLANPSGNVCAGIQQVSVKIMNGGINVINNVQVHWSVNGTAQTPVTYTNPINTLTSPAGNIATVVLGNVNFTTTPTNLKVWTYLPNGVADTVTINDTLSVTVAASLSGTFTVNSAVPTGGTNYQTFTALANDLNTYGVCGPLTVNVVAGSGPYNEVVKFNDISGTSATNKIRINGNGATVQFSNTATVTQLLTLNGTKYMTIDSLNFKALASGFGWGSLITGGAAFDTIRRCTFDLTSITATSSTYSNGITFSASATSATSAGTNGSNCYIGYNKVLGPTGAGGPYYGLTLAGTNTGNVLDHNEIHNFYYYGLYVSGGTNNSILGNDINRSDKITVTSTFYGLYLTGSMPGAKVLNNRIHDPADPSVNSANSFYGLYASSVAGDVNNRNLIANNAVYNINQGSSLYGIYLPTTSYTDVYHNTVVIDKAVSGSGTTYGIYASGSTSSTNIRNNNVSITAGNTGIKYGFYYSSLTTIADIQRNNIYMNSSQTGTQYYGYLAAAYNSITAFHNAYPALEAGSLDVDPQFIAPATGNLIPGNYALLGNGLNLTATVPNDIIGVTRMTVPTPGAFEIAPVGTNNAGSVNMLTPKGSFCAGLQPVNVSVVNAGTNNITNMKIHWQVNGVDQPVYNYTATLNSILNAGQFLDTVLLGNANFAAGSPTTIKIWTFQPNNSADNYNGNDTITFTLEPSVFTIDAVKDTLCPGGSTTITLDPSTGYTPGNLNWQKSTNGTVWNDINNTDVVTYNTGALTADNFFRVKVSGGVNACYSDSLKILVVNPQLLNVDDTARCGEGAVTLTAEVSLNALAKWYDSPTATTPVATGASFATPFLTASTTYYVAAGIGSGPATCQTAMTPVTITINPMPVVDLGSNINDCVDSGYVGVLDAGIHPFNVTYLWDDNSTAQLRAYNASGIYGVAVTNQYGCVGSDSVSVVLRPNPVVELGNDTSICNGATLTLDAGDEGIEYYWNTGNTSQTLTITHAGSYNVFVTNAEGCIKSDTIFVDMQGELPVVDGILVTNNGDRSFTFTAVNPQNVIGYDWDFGDNTQHSFLSSPTHTYADNGDYIVVLKLSSTCGYFTDSSAAHIVGINQINVSNDELNVYPNPATDAVTILNKGALSMKQIEVINILGQVVYKAAADSKDRHTLQLNGLSSGIYTIEIFTDKGNVARKLEVRR